MKAQEKNKSGGSENIASARRGRETLAKRSGSEKKRENEALIKSARLGTAEAANGCGAAAACASRA